MKKHLVLFIALLFSLTFSGCETAKQGEANDNYYVITLVGFNGTKYVELFIDNRVVYDGYPTDNLVIGRSGRYYYYTAKSELDIRIIIKQASDGIGIGEDMVTLHEFGFYKDDGRHIQIDFNSGDVATQQASGYFQYY